MRRLLVAVTLLASGYGAAEETGLCFGGTGFAQCAALFEQLIAGHSLSVSEANQVAWYEGYVTGTAETMNSAGIMCLPSQATQGQGWAVTAKYIRENPGMWHYDRTSLTETALLQAFPCKPPAAPNNRKK